MIASNYPVADAIRLIALALTVSAIASFPSAIFLQGRPGRLRTAWIAVIGCEVFMISATLAMADYFGHPLVWYRTPLAGLGASLILTFNIIEYNKRSKGRK